MKRSTLLLLLLAALGGALIYYLEIKPGKSRDEKPDETKAAYSFAREDITGVTVTRAGKPVTLENQNGKWVITAPVNAAADESALNSLIGDLVSARIEREFAASSDLKEYGLASPAVTLELKLKNGQTRRLELGGKDAVGSSAYARFDGAQNITLVGASVLTSADKSLDDLRDRSVLGATQYEITSLKTATETGGFELAKEDSTWVLKSPVAGPTEESVVNNLLGDLTSAKATEVVSETADDPAKYGLDKPKSSLTVKLATGAERTVSIGSKVDDKFHAKVSDRPQVLKVEQAFLDKLNTKLADLRSKEIVKLDRENLKTISIKNPNGTLVAENKDGKWMVTEPADKKDKEAQTFKIFTPFESKASEVLDKPSAAVLAKLAKPAVEVRLTDKGGKNTIVKISAAEGEDCYIRVEGRAGVYKLNKTMLESLSFKMDEAVQ
jgi:Domain of unknown function (DUF4340)